MKMKPWIILKPFAADVWWLIVVLVIIIVILLSFILKQERADDYSCSISALVAVGALSQQGICDYKDGKIKICASAFFYYSISARFPVLQ